MDITLNELYWSLRLPANRITFALAVLIRLFWTALFQAATVGLFG